MINAVTDHGCSHSFVSLTAQSAIRIQACSSSCIQCVHGMAMVLRLMESFPVCCIGQGTVSEKLGSRLTIFSGKYAAFLFFSARAMISRLPFQWDMFGQAL